MSFCRLFRPFNIWFTVGIRNPKSYVCMAFPLRIIDKCSLLVIFCVDKPFYVDTLSP